MRTTAISGVPEADFIAQSMVMISVPADATSVPVPFTTVEDNDVENVETFSVDYTEKRLRLKQRGGRTWNFTTKAANADPLFVFHRDVEAARPKP